MKKSIYISAIIATFCNSTYSQERRTLDLQETIRIAADSSLYARKYKNQLESSYWEFRAYKAERLPSLTLNVMPIEYYRYLTKRYDSENDIDVYRQQQVFTSSAALSLTQNFAPLGGYFYATTSLERMRNYGSSDYTQYSSVPIKIGYSNSLLGYNEHRWNKKIEPLKYEKAKLYYLYYMEYLSSLAIQYFFNLANAQASYDLAILQSAQCDTLYNIGKRRIEIASITQTDIMRLRLDAVKARTAKTSAEVALKEARMQLASFLSMNPNAELHINMPGILPDFEIDTQKALEMMHKNSYELLDVEQAVLEAEQTLDKVRKQTRFQANVGASVGFNQQGDAVSKAYQDPMRQDIVSINITIPLLDWGVNRGKRNMAYSQMEIARISAQQTMAEKEQEILVTISELRSRRELYTTAEETLTLADKVYDQTMKRFISGTSDLTALTQAQGDRLSAQESYINAIYKYWDCYYKLRRLTLFDFSIGFSLSDKFDLENEINK